MNIKKIIKTNCVNCNAEIYRREWYAKNKKCFCNVGCGRQYKYKTENPKTVNIVNTENPNFYYLIGLIATDGHIQWPGCTPSSKAYRVIIELNQKDLYLLERLQNEFGGKIISTKSNCKKWIIHNMNFIHYLRDIVNMSHNKSLNLDISVWFNTLTTDNKLHFLLGVIDGDGSILLNKMRNNTKQLRLRIYSGSKNFLIPIKDFLHDGFINSVNEHNHSFCANGIIAQKILNMIYEKRTDLFLKRKYDIYHNYSQ